MATIRLLHASDLHVCRFLNIRQISKREISKVNDSLQHFTFAPAYNRGTLSRFVSFLRQRRESLDGLIITGDIATTGRDFDLAKAFTVVKSRIEPLGLELCMFPGNHDRWTPYRKGYDSAMLSFGYDPGGRDFHNVFNEFWGPRDIKSITLVKDDFRVNVIAADFSLRSARDAETWTFVNKHGQGNVYEDVLKQLEQETRRAMAHTETTNAVLWAIHFPPFCPDIGSDMRLLNERDLLDKATELGVPIILAGHSHIARRYPALPYNTHVYCAGTLAEYNAGENQFFVMSLTDEDGDYRVDLDSYMYDRLRRRFMRSQVRQ